ncbi:DUF397 domain-containing protein [Streptomyces sp. NBS 14/10]|uniref:DUF397 domain-containing protein n=1 Tax=Streptomyces sp. NBS 14/10 TaxID=1945643 RepID=UPI000B7D5A6D|nr:DUF397 domain-containing protein [Streptomyces sp. NBS 14/10]KAK1183053.1 DUF397 domain-containing protein [Streptomyces sp. NBS 14/10]
MNIQAPATTIAAATSWTKSSYSGGEGGECVEVAVTDHIVRVRDSKDVTRPHLAVGRADWARFVRYVARG